MRIAVRESGAETAASKAAGAKPPAIASEAVPDTLAALKVDPKVGLSHTEVDPRRQEHGYNQVVEQKAHPVRKFLGKGASRDLAAADAAARPRNKGNQITVRLLLTCVTPGADHAVVSARSRSYQVSTSPASVTSPPSAVTVMLSASI
jgi:hypothetical protein